MAIKINFDTTYNPEEPTFVLGRKNGDIIGGIVSKSIEVSDELGNASEVSFKVDKYVDGKKCDLWEQIVDFKLVYCVEWDIWFEITVELDENTETTKTVFCTRLGNAELSQIMLFGVEINTEQDIAREEYKTPTILYNAEDTNASLLHRIFEKAPHYKIIHVDSTIAKIQRTFSFDNVSICDACLKDISKEINCLFVFNSNSDENGRPQRTVSVYDLESNCLECGYRGEFTEICPECGSKNIDEGYGVDTSIFITADKLANDIQLSTDIGAVKNCFKLEAGDDLMTATVRNCNPNGTDYIWHISDKSKIDMSDDLIKKINSYNEIYNMYQRSFVVDLNDELLLRYNTLVDKYKIYNKDLEKISIPVIGYPSLMNAYYNTIDLATFLQSSLMPTVAMGDTNAQLEASKLAAHALSPVSVASIADISISVADNAVLSMAKLIVDSRYRVKVSASTLTKGDNCQVWRGSFIITNYSNEEDVSTSEMVDIIIDNNYSSFVQQKIQKSLNKDNIDNLSVSGLFEKPYNEFLEELKKYSLNCLNSFYSSCQTCIDILIDQGIADKNTWADQESNLYDELYLPYLSKLSAIESEIKIRQDEIDLIIGTHDADNELKTYGLQTYIEKTKGDIQNELDFQNYLGSELWLEFCSFRREDKYSNANYVSDGLNNADLFKRAYEFIQTAQKEIYKSSELQHSISISLKNLLVIKKFKQLVNSFEVGNWLRVMIDDEVYKLRLLRYSIAYDDIDNISVKFSDVVKIKDSITSMKDVVSQVSTMATSYDSVKRQAKQGEKSNTVVDNWINNGLNTTNTKIIGGADNETQTWDKHGMMFRKYDSVTDSYDDTQLKIIHSTIAITDDNWETVRTAIGAYYYFHPKTNELVRTYGVNGEVIVGKLLLGERLGIYNENNSLSFDNDGLVVSNGINTFKVDPNSKALLTISNNEEDVFYVDNNGRLHITGDGSGIDVSSNSTITDLSSQITQTSDAINLKVGYADIISAINMSPEQIKIDANRLTIDVSELSIDAKNISLEGLVTANGNFKILEDGSMEALNAVVSGKITTDDIKAMGGTIGDWHIGKYLYSYTNDYVSGLSGCETEYEDFRVVNKASLITDGYSNVRFFAGVPKPDSLEGHFDINDGNFMVLEDGSLYAMAAKIDGEINAKSGIIGGCDILNGVLQISNANISEKLTADKIDATSLEVDAANITGIFTVKSSNNKTLFSAGGNKVSIGGWNVDSNSLYSGSTFGNSDCFFCTGSTGKGIEIGGSTSITGWVLKAGSNFGVTNTGAVHANDIYLNAGYIAGWNITKDGLTKDSIGYETSFCVYPKGMIDSSEYGIFGTKGLTWCMGVGSNFGVTNTGAVYANDIYLSGNIRLDGIISASNSSLGGWNVGTINIGAGTTVYNGVALYSEGFYDSTYGTEVAVALTPDTVYIYGLDSTGSSFVDYTTWAKIIRASNK